MSDVFRRDFKVRILVGNVQFDFYCHFYSVTMSVCFWFTVLVVISSIPKVICGFQFSNIFYFTFYRLAWKEYATTSIFYSIFIFLYIMTRLRFFLRLFYFSVILFIDFRVVSFKLNYSFCFYARNIFLNVV